MIRSLSYKIDFANKQKLENYKVFLAEYRKVAQQITNEIWNNGYETFNFQQDKLELPKFIDYNKFSIETSLSARALSSLTTQLSGCIRAVVQKQKERLYRYNLTKSEKLLKKIEKTKMSCPDLSTLNPELSSKCTDIEMTEGHFNAFLRMSSIGKTFGHIKIPIKFHKRTKKFNDWTRLNSFLLKDNTIEFRYEKETPEKKTSGRTVGIDQGMTTCVTMSDGQVSKTDCHGHALKSICTKLSRKKKGSNAFKKAQLHRTNYINWSINQLDFDGIKEIRLENVKQLRYKTNTSRLMQAFSYPLIRQKLERKAEEEKVSLILQSSPFRSQRCSECGWVQKKNRNGKQFHCSKCDHDCDADLNAALNHEQDLSDIPFSFVSSKKNLNGFYWNQFGIFEEFGQEIGVSDCSNKEIFI